jgi:hypothetical protein
MVVVVVVIKIVMVAITSITGLYGIGWNAGDECGYESDGDDGGGEDSDG